MIDHSGKPTTTTFPALMVAARVNLKVINEWCAPALPHVAFREETVERAMGIEHT